MSKLIPEIETRRARRAPSENPVPEDVLARIMTAATYAPSYVLEGVGEIPKGA